MMDLDFAFSPSDALRAARRVIKGEPEPIIDMKEVNQRRAAQERARNGKNVTEAHVE